MPVVLIILALAVGAGLLAGGSLRFLEQFRVHWWALAPIALLLQVTPIASGSAQRAGLAAASLVASYILLLACGAKRRDARGRRMIRVAGAHGVVAIEDGAKHHLMSGVDTLQPLGDVIPVPPPFRVVFSIGDLLLYGGMAWWCFAVTRGRFRENRRPPARRFLMYRGKHAPLAYRLPARYRLARATAPAATARSGTSR
jgi:hypothetical protein